MGKEKGVFLVKKRNKKGYKFKFFQIKGVDDGVRLTRHLD